jgi:alpha-L-arabinofuranosidase
MFQLGLWSIGNENWGQHEIGYKPIDQWAPFVLEAANAKRKRGQASTLILADLLP